MQDLFVHKHRGFSLLNSPSSALSFRSNSIIQFSQTNPRLVAFVTAMLSLCEAAPTPGTSDATGGLLTKRVNDCGDSFFEDRTTDASPLVSDCATIGNNNVDGGDWAIGCAESSEHTFVTFGTCAFGVRQKTSGCPRVCDLTRRRLIAEYQARRLSTLATTM